MVKALRLLPLLSFLVSSAFAADPPPRVSDEGGAKSVYFNLDCVGAGVACSTSGINATITVAGTLPTNGTNCSAASFPLGVDASGNAESCSTSISGNAATATALAANGANCSAGSGAGGVDASGASEDCTDYYSTLAELQTAVTNDFHNLGGTDDDVPESGDFTNLTDGTNLTFSPAGTLNVDNPVVANLTGNASTATALAANGANCAASSFPLGVDASGVVESCSTSISGNAATATALAANGANCSAGNYPLGVDASGATESCTALTFQHITDQGKDTTNYIALTHTSANADAYEGTIDINATRSESDLNGFFGINNALIVTGTTHTGYPAAYNGSISYQGSGALSAGGIYGLNFLTRNLSNVAIPYMNSIAAQLQKVDGTLTTGIGIDSILSNDAGNATDLIGIRVNKYSISAGTVTNAYGLKVDDWATMTGTNTNNYGVYVSDITKGTNQYPLFLADAAEAFFRDANTEIYSPSSGTLRLNATTALNVNGAYTLPVADGTANYVLKTDGAGAVTWQADTGGAGSPGGADEDMQYNNAGAFGGTTGMHWDDINAYLQFDDNVETVFGTGDDASMYYDGTSLIIDPDLVGSGAVKIGATGNNDLEVDEMSLCGTGLAGSTAIVNGSCSGSKRGVLSFSYTKNAGTGVTANVASSLTYNLAANANSSGFSSTYTVSNFSTGTNTHNHYNTSGMNVTSDLTSGTHQFRGINLVAPIAPASSAGATVYQIGVHQREMTAFPSASAEVIAGIVLENNSLITSGDKLYLEGSGGASPAYGDSYLWYDNSDNDLEIFAENLQVADFDDDLTQFGDVVAGNYFQFYNAASGVIPEGSLKPVGNAIIAIDGDKPVFCYSGDVDACFYFSTTNSYEFRDLGGTARFNLDVVNGDIEVGTASRGIDSVTAANDLTIGRVNAGDIVYGNLANTPSHTFATTDSATSVIMDATTPLQVTQPTIGDQVTTLKSTATNDDPVEYVRMGRTTTTSTGATAIITLTPQNNYTTTVDCTILARRTGGVSGAADDGAGYKRYATFKKNAGTVTQIGATTATATHESVAGWDATITVSGATVLVNGTGALTTDITWHSTCRIYEVGT